MADLATVIVLASFTFTTLVNEPGTLIAMVVIVLLSVALDLTWKSRRDRGAQSGADSSRS